MTTKNNPPPLNFTEAAARKAAELISEEGNSELCLRVFITGGGCSGFQYGFMFDDKINDDDTVVEAALETDNKKQGARLVIDPMSLQYLRGADIDYQEDINGAQFIIRNPNAKTTCGCGSSFSVD